MDSSTDFDSLSCILPNSCLLVHPSPYYVGIVGHASDKFTSQTKRLALNTIEALLSSPESVLVSGHCHLGGIDIWAERIAKSLGRDMIIYPPSNYNWQDGYKPRNLQIARKSHIVHCLVVKDYPSGYKGMRFDRCYHCGTSNHVKSGGCWTMKKCREMGRGKQSQLWIIGD